MRRIFLFLLLFQFLQAFPQGAPGYDRLSAACELWGLIKYFHPSQPGDAFDSAFAAQVPQMIGAGSEEQFAGAIGSWLKVLNDPVTRLVPPGRYLPGNPKSMFTGDSLLVVTISGSSFFSDYMGAMVFMEQVASQLKHARGVIFDLRQTSRPDPSQMGVTGSYFREAGLNQRLAGENVPCFRSVYRSGFKKEGEMGATFYEVNNILKPMMEAGTNQNFPAVWIVNENSDLPEVALSMQASGTGSILSDGSPVEMLLPFTHPFRLGENLSVAFRTADLVMPGGAPAEADQRYQAGEDPVAMALAMIRRDRKEDVKVERLKVEGLKVEGWRRAVYPEGGFPSVGYRLLAAAKIYTVIDLFFPYRQYMEGSWKETFTASLADFIKASNETEYGLAVAKLYAHIRDSHGFMTGNRGLDQLGGEAPSPVFVEWVEDQAVITRFRDDSLCRALGINIGDVVLKVDGVPVKELIDKTKPFFAYSTPQSFLPDAARRAIRGPEGKKAVFTIRPLKGKTREVEVTWSRQHQQKFRIENPMDTLELLPGNIGYADLTRLEIWQVDEMFERFKETRAIIFDMRGYPRGTAWSIAPRLTEKYGTPVALFRRQEVMTPKNGMGEIATTVTYTESTQVMPPAGKPAYKGRTLMLIDHNAISQSEHTGMIFKVMGNTTFFGSPTAGANGDITTFVIPGNITLAFSGQGVWWPDGKQLQCLGLLPDVPVAPTIKGISEGKDEILDAAVLWIKEKIKQ